MKQNKRLIVSLLLLMAMVLTWLPGVHASISASANPNSGTIYYFPAVPDYQNFSVNLTVTGSTSGTPTWTYAPAAGSPGCANYIYVTFGSVHAWNTTATFNDHSSQSCQATINVTVSSPTAGSAQTSVSVTYGFCRNCL